LCERGGGEPGDHDTRAARRCALPDFDPRAWIDVGPVAAEAEMMAEDLQMLLDTRLGVDYSFARDGCPWAWAHSRFAVEVAKLAGRRTLESPVRSPSLRLTRRMLRDEVEPEHLLEAVDILEAFEDNALALYYELCSP
jgi:hypothetical protein